MKCGLEMIQYETALDIIIASGFLESPAKNCVTA
jgi:hypothetical protein